MNDRFLLKEEARLCRVALRYFRKAKRVLLPHKALASARHTWPLRSSKMESKVGLDCGPIQPVTQWISSISLHTKADAYGPTRSAVLSFPLSAIYTLMLPRGGEIRE